MVNLWKDNEEHSKSAEELVIGSEEEAEETHDEGGRSARGGCNPKL